MTVWNEENLTETARSLWFPDRSFKVNTFNVWQFKDFVFSSEIEYKSFKIAALRCSIWYVIWTTLSSSIYPEFISCPNNKKTLSTWNSCTKIRCISRHVLSSSKYFPSLSNSLQIWKASSRVLQITIHWKGSPGRTIEWSTPKTKTAVFPIPDLAWQRRSSPRVITGIPSLWTYWITFTWMLEANLSNSPHQLLS